MPSATGLSDVGAPFVFDEAPQGPVPGSGIEALPGGSGSNGTHAGPEHNVENHTNGYCLLDHELCARRSFTILQGLVLAVLLAGTGISLYIEPEVTIIVVSLLFSGFYLCVVLFRLRVLSAFRYQKPVSFTETHPMPAGRYIILVALYREASQVASLAQALQRLRWRNGDKQIHLICEADDADTISAIRTIRAADIHLHIVPPGAPRTKPRALNYVLQQVRGDYLVLYDAEDRPHPDQLLEAALAFEGGNERLACLQAPLSIDNRRESIMARFFAIEYDTLFRGILPVLADWRAPIPLGGTSNHFRLPHLLAAGGWDSFNVTEDADLGIRLARCGLDCRTLTLPTHEEAPARPAAWMRQRTRWIKGWLQTLLVHLRRPGRTLREMGWRRFLQFHMVLTAVVVSVLVHPFFLAAFVMQMYAFAQAVPQSTYGIWITGISVFNLVAGYLSYGLLAWVVQDARGTRSDKAFILFFPLYWLLISVAGWLAVAQLLYKPHYWAKTEHGSLWRQTPAHTTHSGSGVVR